MTNGFYDLTGLDTVVKRRKFFRNAMMLSYDVACEIKYKNDVDVWRMVDVEVSITDRLKEMSMDTHITCVDRYAYGGGQISKADGEVCANKFGDSWRFLYCHMSLDNLKRLVDRYELKLIEI